MEVKTRCPWANADPLMQTYHDHEWGVPVHDDIRLFEFLTLEGAQAGLSWLTILKRREGYNKAFCHFDPQKVARFKQNKIDQLMQNPDIIRNKLKIESTISNAISFMKIQKEYGSFDKYCWDFIGGKPLKNKFSSMKEVPAKTDLSDAFSKDLKKRGFKFVGSTIVYAYMQATGLVNDHLVDCFRHRKIK